MNKLSDDFIKYFMPVNSTHENIDLEITILNGIRKLEDDNSMLIEKYANVVEKYSDAVDEIIKIKNPLAN